MRRPRIRSTSSHRTIRSTSSHRTIRSRRSHPTSCSIRSCRSLFRRRRRGPWGLHRCPHHRRSSHRPHRRSTAPRRPRRRSRSSPPRSYSIPRRRAGTMDRRMRWTLQHPLPPCQTRRARRARRTPAPGGPRGSGPCRRGTNARAQRRRIPSACNNDITSQHQVLPTACIAAKRHEDRLAFPILGPWPDLAP